MFSNDFAKDFLSGLTWAAAGGTPSETLAQGCAASFPKPLPYLRPNSSIFLCPTFNLTKNSILFL